VFADFYDGMRQPDGGPAVSGRDLNMVGDYLVRSSAIYSKEESRVAALSPILQELVNKPIMVVKLEDGTSNDGVGVVAIGPHLGLVLLCEWKGEIGDGGCDPSVQAGFGFTRWWSQSKVDEALLVPLLPSRIFRRRSVATYHSAPLFFFLLPGPGCLFMGVSCLGKSGLCSH